MSYAIGDMDEKDLSRGFLESLEELGKAELSREEAGQVLRGRVRAGVRTFVARDGDRVVGTASLLIEQKFYHSAGRAVERTKVWGGLIQRHRRERRLLGACLGGWRRRSFLGLALRAEPGQNVAHQAAFLRSTPIDRRILMMSAHIFIAIGRLSQ